MVFRCSIYIFFDNLGGLGDRNSHIEDVSGQHLQKSSTPQPTDILSNNNLNMLPDIPLRNIEVDQQSTHTNSVAGSFQELSKRLKNIGCWDNTDKVALNLIEQQKRRRLELAARELEIQNEARKRPALKSKSKARKAHTTLLHPNEIAYHFERFSGLKLSKGCLPVLVDAFQKFTNLMMNKLKENNVGDQFCLADLKKVMQQFGFIPANDFKNRELFCMLRELMDPEDEALLIPMSTFNGIRGATTLQRDIWTKVPKSRNKGRQKRKLKK